MKFQIIDSPVTRQDSSQFEAQNHETKTGRVVEWLQCLNRQKGGYYGLLGMRLSKARESWEHSYNGSIG